MGVEESEGEVGGFWRKGGEERMLPHEHEHYRCHMDMDTTCALRAAARVGFSKLLPPPQHGRLHEK